MLTLSLQEVISDPTTALTSVLNFVWREDWEYEGHGGKNTHQQPKSHDGSWEREARELINSGMNDIQNNNNHKDSTISLLQRFLERTKIVLQETNSSARNRNNNTLKKSIQGAFASEMKRSSDMTSWPCPSFWEGVDSHTSNNNADNEDQMRVLSWVSGEMAPNCRDDDPFVRCTVNKDRCEVKRDAKCK